jgi:hypothetical protein
VRYEREATALWKAFVPKYGQAKTVQGELVRAVEKLRDEAHRDGNVNWNRNHAMLAQYVKKTLIDSRLFDAAVVEEIKNDIKRIRVVDYPEIEDEPYDRLLDRIVEWSIAHPDPVSRELNPKLTC